MSKSIHVDSPCCSKDIQINYCYAIVRNIPPILHSSALRNYFSFYVENGVFECFHFRHRPEKIENGVETNSKTTTTCCVIKFRSLEERSQFIKDYNDKQWTNEESFPLKTRCYVDSIKISKNDAPSTSNTAFTEKDLQNLIELRPPALLPQGNVGTPTSYFMEQIKLCKLPPSLIKKLGLKTQRKVRKFGNVPMDYGVNNNEEKDEFPEKSEPKVNLRTNDPLDPTEQYLKRQAPDNDEGPDDDDDQCEEWERHEALHNDVTEQDRTKERNYEPELELVWEKGGPGLVWHTDKNYWDETEKGDDIDWAWADDWDVDYSVYYEGKSSGTIDGRHAVEIREDEARWSGKLNDTVFREKVDPSKNKRKRMNSYSDSYSDFRSEYGSKLMKRMGWTPGMGLGKKSQGKIQPVAVQIEEDANLGKERKGIGYHGEIMQRTGFTKTKVNHTISSIFDKDDDRNRTEDKRVKEGEPTSELLLRSAEPTKMKYRSRLVYPEE